MISTFGMFNSKTDAEPSATARKHAAAQLQTAVILVTRWRSGSNKIVGNPGARNYFTKRLTLVV